MPPKRSIPKIMHRAGELRKEPSAAEAKMWAYLRTLREDGIRFRRQHAIGPYITDFSPKGDDVRAAQ
jgi:very-short-patch-repair endonuclease